MQHGLHDDTQAGLAATPISVLIPQAVALTGFSRSRLHELIRPGEIVVAKDGNCTLVLVGSLTSQREIAEQILAVLKADGLEEEDIAAG